MELAAYLYTNPGGRPHNEDNAGFQCAGEEGFFVVADGLGGHQNGERASALVVESMLDSWQKECGELSPVDCRQWMEESVRLANASLLDAQKRDKNGMKSTVVALGAKGGRAAWSHVGDSRLYHIRDGKINWSTRDHSVSYKKYLAREITLREINFDEDRSSLLRVVGDEDRCIPESGEPWDDGELQPGDAFLLCTDGFWEYIYGTEILIDCLKADSPRKWAENMLVRILPRIRANSDNMTLLTVFVK